MSRSASIVATRSFTRDPGDAAIHHGMGSPIVVGTALGPRRDYAFLGLILGRWMIATPCRGGSEFHRARSATGSSSDLIGPANFTLARSHPSSALLQAT
jgi:hypothetical protein